MCILLPHPPPRQQFCRNGTRVQLSRDDESSAQLDGVPAAVRGAEHLLTRPPSPSHTHSHSDMCVPSQCSEKSVWLLRARVVQWAWRALLQTGGAIWRSSACRRSPIGWMEAGYRPGAAGGCGWPRLGARRLQGGGYCAAFLMGPSWFSLQLPGQHGGHLLPVGETFSWLKRPVCFLGDGRAYHMLPSPLSEDDSSASSLCSCASPDSQTLCSCYGAAGRLRARTVSWISCCPRPPWAVALRLMAAPWPGGAGGKHRPP